MPDEPFLTREAVGKLGGVGKETVSRYLTRSNPGGPYADDPFPAPDGKYGKAPWWRFGREDEIRAWFERRKDRSGVGGRPRKDAGKVQG